MRLSKDGNFLNNNNFYSSLLTFLLFFLSQSCHPYEESIKPEESTQIQGQPETDIPEFSELKIINRKKPNVPPEEFIPFRVSSDIDIPPMPAFGEGYRIPVSSFSRTETGSPTTNPEITMNLIR